MIHGMKEEEDYQDFLEVKDNVEENIKTELQFMNKGKNKNLLMDLWNILIGERQKENRDKYVLIVGKNILKLQCQSLLKKFKNYYIINLNN